MVLKLLFQLRSCGGWEGVSFEMELFQTSHNLMLFIFSFSSNIVHPEEILQSKKFSQITALEHFLTKANSIGITVEQHY